MLLVSSQQLINNSTSHAGNTNSSLHSNDDLFPDMPPGFRPQKNSCRSHVDPRAWAEIVLKSCTWLKSPLAAKEVVVFAVEIMLKYHRRWRVWASYSTPYAALSGGPLADSEQVVSWQALSGS